ncbi:MAG: protoheme IX farnesyltransferase [Zetaproteobacteria bacterium]|nr:protoheme IX farnesyltransferase [Pseudobdellovibrionaceae bacterium]|tara:strand:+ start:1109 stop:2026 length:918 start_codon:yes stop_codon:yes gene_type:complete
MVSKNLCLGVQREKRSSSLLYDCFILTKPTITLLVVVTTLPSLLLASKQMPSLFMITMTLLGTALASGSAAVFNQLIESKIDCEMERTKKRSLPSGRLSNYQAAIFAVIMGLAAFLILYFLAKPLAAFIAFAGHVYYVFFYTMFLKKKTPQNIVIGGAAGAVGPLIGWAAVTGTLDWPAWILFLMIVLWTPPHFWALALKYKEDYAKVGIPMYPVIYGDKKTHKQMFLYTLSLVPTIVVLYIGGVVGVSYLFCAGAFTIKFIWDAYKLLLTGDNKLAMPLFHYSCTYAFILFLGLVFDKWLQNII